MARPSAPPRATVPSRTLCLLQCQASLAWRAAEAAEAGGGDRQALSLRVAGNLPNVLKYYCCFLKLNLYQKVATMTRVKLKVWLLFASKHHPTLQVNGRVMLK